MSLISFLTEIAMAKKGELKSLGKTTQHVYKGADASLLEIVPNPSKEHNVRLEVTIEGEEFTCVCPVTGGPDYGAITIIYTPQDSLVESKSLKLYLESFRQEGIFHEKVVSKICEDLGQLLRPVNLRVQGKFKPRGGWAIYPVAQYRR